MSVTFDNKKKTDFSQVRHQAIGQAKEVNAAPVEVLGIPTDDDTEVIEVQPNGQTQEEIPTAAEMDAEAHELEPEGSDEGPDSHQE